MVENFEIVLRTEHVITYWTCYYTLHSLLRFQNWGENLESEIKVKSDSKVLLTVILQFVWHMDLLYVDGHLSLEQVH